MIHTLEESLIKYEIIYEEVKLFFFDIFNLIHFESDYPKIFEIKLLTNLIKIKSPSNCN